MKGKYIKSGLIGLVALFTIVSIAAMGGMAHEGHDTTTNVTVGDNSTEYDYTTIQGAVDNASEYNHIVIQEGTYNTSVNLSTNNLYFEAESGNVTIDGSNTSSGVAFQNPNDYNYTTADNVELIGMSSGGSGTSDGSNQIMNLVTSTVFGIPYWLIAIALIAIAYVANERQN